ncbi:MAG: hypothetical protein KKF56_04150 [Nanoarchaeota archaeon]|nr:hypothetical protein [Nanoarchaeota archaeon]
MQRQDIMSGLQHSLERGEDLEKAKQSFLDAGYPIQDINDSANAISSGVVQNQTSQQTQPTSNTPLTITSQPTQQSQTKSILPTINHQTETSLQTITPTSPTQPPTMPNTQFPTTQSTNPPSPPQTLTQPKQLQTQQPVPKIQKKSKKTLIIIIILAVVLLLALGGLLLVILKPDWLTNLFS